MIYLRCRSNFQFRASIDSYRAVRNGNKQTVECEIAPYTSFSLHHFRFNHEYQVAEKLREKNNRYGCDCATIFCYFRGGNFDLLL